MVNRDIGGVYTRFFDTLKPIPKWWLRKAYYVISNWNKDGSAEISGFKAVTATITPDEVILYDGFGGHEIFRMTNQSTMPGLPAIQGERKQHG